MGRDEVEVIRRAYEAFNRGDVEGALQHVDPDVEWHMSEQFTRTSRVFHGHDGVREVFTVFSDALDGFRAEPLALHDAGGTVIAEVHASGLVRGTGEQASYLLNHAWTMRDRRALRLDVYPTLEEAWTATGMTPPAPSSASISAPGSGRANR
jgi:ketosteroid isomerase-like protein